MKHKLLMSLPLQYQTALKIIANPKRINNFKNDYNVTFLPDTQYVNLNYQQLNLGYTASPNIKSRYSGSSEQISYKNRYF